MSNGPETRTGGEPSPTAIVVAVVGGLASLGLLGGAVGPGAGTPAISVSGWAGLGFPLLLVAFVVVGLQLLELFRPRRTWYVITAVLAAISLGASIVLLLLVSLLAHVGSLVVLLLARGHHGDAFDGK